ncbi:MAG TPA: hypothetical protein VGK73_31740 [Polyangiaceae bacterium]
MAQAGTSYADWLRNNRNTVDQAVARVAPPAAAPAPAQPAAAPAPVTIQVNAGGAQPTTTTPAAQMKPPEAAPQPAPETPAAEPAPTPEPASPPPVAPVSMPGKGNLRTQQADIQADRIADMNAVGQSHIREGEAAAAGQANVAKAIEDVNAKAAPLADAAQANAAANAEQSGKYKRYMDEDIEALRKPLIDDRSAWEKAGGILSGIVSAMFQGRGMVGNAISYGMGALESHINKSLEDQLNAKDSAGKSLPHVQKAMKTLAEDSNDQTEIASKLMANQYLMAENKLKQIGAETKVPEIKENAFRLAVAARDKANEYAENIVAARLKAAASNPKTDWSKFPLATLEAWESSGQLPGAGVQYLDSVRAGKLKNRGAVSEIEARDAAAVAAAQKAAGGGGPEGADERKLVRLLEGVGTSVNAMRKLAASGGTPPHPFKENLPDAILSEETLNQQADMQAIADILLRDESGAAIGDAEAEKKKRGWGITSGDPEVRRRGLQKMLAEYDARLAAVGVQPKVPQRPPPPRAEVLVAVRAPDGSIRNIAQSKVPMALQAGGKLVSEETRQVAPAAMADASNADYEAQVRREQGY